MFKNKFTRLINFLKELRDLKAVSYKRILYLISIIISVMIFDALSILSVMPLIQFIQANQNIDEFMNSVSYGKQLVNVYNFLSIPFTLVNLSIILLLFVASRQFMNIFEVQESERTKLTIAKNLSVNCFKGIMFAKASYIRGIKQGKFTALCESECVNTSFLYKGILQLISVTLQISAYAAVMFYVAPYMTALAILIISLLILSMYSLVRRSHIAGINVVQARKNFYNFISENFSLWRLFKFGGSINNEVEEINSLAESYAERQLDVIKYSNRSRFIIAIVAMSLCVLFLNLSVNYFSFNFEKITLFALIFIRLIPLGQKLNAIINSIFSWAPSFLVVTKILNESYNNREDLDLGIEFLNKNILIEFKNVSFSYDASINKRVLENINLVIPPNKITAIVGRSGAGKSTLIDLLPRIISPNSGEIYIDGYNIKNYSLSSFRRQISFVSQDTILFDGSIRDNISYYIPDSNNAEIIKASTLSGAAEFIDKLPEKYDYNIGEKGQKLSGGQKQRLILARAFLSKSKILILDEATSSLDHESEVHVKKSINEFIKINNSTIIIIAHRHTTIESADFVVYLEDGKISGTGSPEEIFSKYLKV
jgi:ABC-type multidrug transport system fused ATPase/permease subunit